MRVALLAGVKVVTLAVSAVVALALLTTTETGEGDVQIEPLTTLAPPVELTRSLPSSWIEGLEQSVGGELLQLSCEDTDGDGVLTRLDRIEFDGMVIPLLPDKACIAPDRSADYYVGPPTTLEAYNCASEQPPALVVAVGSAGSDLLDPSEGESLGVLALVNTLQRRATDAGIATAPVLTASAIFGAQPPQRSLEQFLARQVSARLDAVPCLRAVLVGHSHGGATVTAVSAALDAAYADRVFGVLIDRTTALYDRPETEYPAQINLLNVFQLNEGWHGIALNRPNVYDIDQSYEFAPKALSDGGGGLVPVSHKTLDDSTGVQRIIADAVLTWLTTSGG
jgi:pimeloyl-ACP methyl ester carboxylesterase